MRAFDWLDGAKVINPRARALRVARPARADQGKIGLNHNIKSKPAPSASFRSDNQTER